jgi:cation diffusion facilitator family transporter
MDVDVIETLRHDHHFLGAQHGRNERKVRAVVVICTVMMIGEIVAGMVFHSMALLADGLHMSTHAGAMVIAALAYWYARRYAHDRRFSFGTGKLGDLSAFTSAVILAIVALYIGWESLVRLFNPEKIAFDQAIAVAVLALGVNLATAFILRDDHGHHGHHHHGHAHGHDHAHIHDHAHEHSHEHAPEHDHEHASGNAHEHADKGRRHGDLNLRAAYVHVLADSILSVLAVVSLVLGRQFGWTWMDPATGLVGMVVIAWWSVGLLRAAGAVLLDMQSSDLAQAIGERLETDHDRVVDLHVWRLGPGHNAALVTLLSREPASPGVYKQRLKGLDLSHVSIEIEPYGVHAPEAAKTSSRGVASGLHGTRSARV